MSFFIKIYILYFELQEKQHFLIFVVWLKYEYLLKYILERHSQITHCVSFHHYTAWFNIYQKLWCFHVCLLVIFIFVLQQKKEKEIIVIYFF